MRCTPIVCSASSFFVSALVAAPTRLGTFLQQHARCPTQNAFAYRGSSCLSFVRQHLCLRRNPQHLSCLPEISNRPPSRYSSNFQGLLETIARVVPVPSRFG